MSKYGRGIVVRFGASHNSIEGDLGVYDMSHPDTEQRKAKEKHARNLMHNIGETLFGKPGSDRNKKRRQRKGYAHA